MAGKLIRFLPVVAALVSGGNYTGEYIAYALPESEIRASGAN